MFHFDTLLVNEREAIREVHRAKFPVSLHHMIDCDTGELATPLVEAFWVQLRHGTHPAIYEDSGNCWDIRNEGPFGETLTIRWREVTYTVVYRPKEYSVWIGPVDIRADGFDRELFNLVCEVAHECHELSGFDHRG